MRTMLAALVFAGGLAIMAGQSAQALPIDAAAIQQAASAASSVQQAQFAVHRHRHGITKCYRDFVIGRYACHTFRSW